MKKNSRKKRKNKRLCGTEILTTFNIADVILIRSILEAEHIDHYFKGESSLQVVKPRVGAVTLIVKQCDADKVRNLLKDIKVNKWITPQENK